MKDKIVGSSRPEQAGSQHHHDEVDESSISDPTGTVVAGEGFDAVIAP